jgi:flavin-dependent dehydrogenase
VIVGAGPAGATAALVLARAGARVSLLDRARFPRAKLCGDTLNPGTLALLRRLGIEDEATRGSVRLRGMRLTGPAGRSVEALYPAGLTAAALSREQLDDRLVRAAVAAGAALEEGVKATAPILESGTVRGVALRTAAGPCVMRAPVTLAADGRSSVLTAAMELSTPSEAYARWAIGAYFEGVAGLDAVGEMHVRPGYYLGVAPLPGGLANAILVLPLRAARQAGGRLPDLLARTLSRDGLLAPRFAGAHPVTAPVILGPLAIDVRASRSPGLLLAGDAAGFIDPITGDGMRFAIAGGELAALAALEALEHGWSGVHERLASRRSRAFHRKWRFNRAVRRLTGSPPAIRALAAAAPLLSPLLARLVRYAGDVGEDGR